MQWMETSRSSLSSLMIIRCDMFRNFCVTFCSNWKTTFAKFTIGSVYITRHGIYPWIRFFPFRIEFGFSVWHDGWVHKCNIKSILISKCEQSSLSTELSTWNSSQLKWLLIFSRKGFIIKRTVDISNSLCSSKTLCKQLCCFAIDVFFIIIGNTVNMFLQATILHVWHIQLKSVIDYWIVEINNVCVRYQVLLWWPNEARAREKKIYYLYCIYFVLFTYCMSISFE